MATEPVSSDHHTTEEPVEKANEETQTVKQEDIFLSKEDVGKDEEEKPKTEESVGLETSAIELEETVGVKQTEPPVFVEVEKVTDVPISDVPAEAGSEGVENSILDLEPSSTPGTGGEAVERQPEEQLAVENQPEEQPANEAVEGQLEERPSMEAVGKQLEKNPVIESAEPKSSNEAVDEPVERLEDVDVEDTEPEVVKQAEKVSEAECKVVEKPELVAEVEEKPQEQTQVIEEVEKTEVLEKPELVAEVEEKPQEQAQAVEEETVEGEVLKNEGTLADEYKDNKYLKEGKTGTDQDPVAFENPVVTDEDSKEEGGDFTSDHIVEKAGAVATVNEDKTAVEGSEDETVLAGRVEEENEEKLEKIEAKNAQTEESIQTETTQIKDVAEVAEKSPEGEQGSKDVEGVIEKERGENVEEDIPTTVETNEDKVLKGKVDEVNATATGDEPIGEPKKSVLEVKAEEAVKTVVMKSVSTKEAADEIAKSDPPTLESSKDGNETKTSEETPRQEVSVKPSPKQSSNIISKVKQSIVKVKKAIIGKYPSSKVLSPETKDDEKVKST